MDRGINSLFSVSVARGLGLFMAGILGTQARAVTQYEPKSVGFITDPTALTQSISLPVKEARTTIAIPYSKLKVRAYKAGDDERIEPLVLDIPRSEQKLSTLLHSLARPGKYKKLSAEIMKRLKKEGRSDQDHEKITVDRELFALLNPEALGSSFAKEHHEVEVISPKLYAQPTLWREFFAQLAPFLSLDDRMRIYNKMRTGTSLNLDHDLLPAFARKMVKKFLVFKGPNCFHATLAFHGQALTRSPFVNVKTEKGYHRAMINYDELWRALYTMFYEVDPRHAPLKYGDIVVFMNIPDTQEIVNFRWIRHAAVYLFGGYTFSKGSKSPNTPYTIKTLDEEWKTWQAYSKNMGVKVFRRSKDSLMKSPPKDLVDWIY